MIFVDRTTVLAPKSLDDPGKMGDRERKRAIKHYSLTPKKTFTFKAYKSDDVKTLLEQLFHKKCAYCEVRYAAAVTVDVEHFRPKGPIKGQHDHPGYWWLASTWSNLLPSCPECNRTGGKYHYDFETGELLGEPSVSGKWDIFPIKGTRAYKDGDDLKNEDHYLINPTEIKPEDHFTWVVKEGISVVSPKLDVNSNLDEYGKYSIEIYGLNRQALVESRSKRILELEEIKLDIISELVEASEIELEEEYVNRRFEKALSLIKRFEKTAMSSEEYSAMAREYVRENLAQILEDFASLFEKKPHAGVVQL